jgi:hypothetical protein
MTGNDERMVKIAGVQHGSGARRWINCVPCALRGMNTSAEFD